MALSKSQHWSGLQIMQILSENSVFSRYCSKVLISLIRLKLLLVNMTVGGPCILYLNHFRILNGIWVVVISCASAMDLPSCLALVEGLGNRKASTGVDVHYIHVRIPLFSSKTGL
jgi:hypothetical protein